MNAHKIAKLFGATPEAVKKQFAKNAAQLAAMAEKAGNGKHRGKTREQWLALANRALASSQQ